MLALAECYSNFMQLGVIAQHVARCCGVLPECYAETVARLRYVEQFYQILRIFLV